MAKRWQYDSLTEPVSTSGEAITIDKWAAEKPSQYFKKFNASGFEYFFFTDQLIIAPEVSTLDKWFIHNPDPVRRTHGHQKYQTLAFISLVESEIITIDKWSSQWPELIRRPQSREDSQALAFVSPLFDESITLDKWFKAYPDSVLRIKDVSSLPHFFFTDTQITPPSEDITSDKWFSQQMAPFFAQSINHLFGIANLLEVITVPIDTWIGNQDHFARMRMPQTPGGIFLVEIVTPAPPESEVNIDKWDSKLFDAVRGSLPLNWMPSFFLVEKLIEVVPTVASVFNASFIIRAVQKIVAVLKTLPSVTKYTGIEFDARIYGAYLQTRTDFSLPTVVIRVISGPGRMATTAFMDVANLSIEIWMRGIGKHANVWDDMYECQNAILDALHRVSLWDSIVGLQVNEMTNTGQSDQVQREDGMMVLATQWRITGAISGEGVTNVSGGSFEFADGTQFDFVDGQPVDFTE